MYANPCLITAGIVPANNYYNVLHYVGSYIPSAIASGCLMTPASGVAPSRLALLCGNRFGAHFTLVYIALCFSVLLVNLSRDTLCMMTVPLMLLCHE